MCSEGKRTYKERPYTYLYQTIHNHININCNQKLNSSVNAIKKFKYLVKIICVRY